MTGEALLPPVSTASFRSSQLAATVSSALTQRTQGSASSRSVRNIVVAASSSSLLEQLEEPNEVREAALGMGAQDPVVYSRLTCAYAGDAQVCGGGVLEQPVELRYGTHFIRSPHIDPARYYTD